MLRPVGKSLGENYLFQGFSTEEEATGKIGYRLLVAVHVVETQGSVDDVLGSLMGGHCWCSLSCFFLSSDLSLQVTAEGTIVLGSGCG